jgi:hypothetical protein
VEKAREHAEIVDLITHREDQWCLGGAHEVQHKLAFSATIQIPPQQGLGHSPFGPLPYPVP